MKIPALLLTIAVAPFAHSGEIITNNNIEVLAINGTEVTSSIFTAQKLEVEDGQQQLVLKYTKTFNKSDLVESRPYIVEVEIKGKTTLNTDKINSKAVAINKMNKGLTWHVSNDDGQYTIKKTEQLIGKGFMPYSDIEGLVENYNKKNNSQRLIVNNQEGQSTENLIIEQYKLATKKQKKQFKIWLIDNETN